MILLCRLKNGHGSEDHGDDTARKNRPDTQNLGQLHPSKTPEAWAFFHKLRSRFALPL